MAISRRVVLHFPRRLVDRPIVYKLIKEYDLEFNILKAMVTPEEEGLLILELKGGRENYDKGMEYLSKNGVRIQALSRDFVRNEERCSHCGACVTICPTLAFEVDSATRRINFHNEKCVACGLCLTACPPRAMEVHF